MDLVLVEIKICNRKSVVHRVGVSVIISTSPVWRLLKMLFWNSLQCILVVVTFAQQGDNSRLKEADAKWAGKEEERLAKNQGVTLITLELNYADNTTQTSIGTEESIELNPLSSIAPAESVEIDVLEQNGISEAENPNAVDSEDPLPACGCVCGNVNRKMRIVGGNETKMNEFPWIVTLSRRGKFYCGGTLITNRHILTAAHCLERVMTKDIKVTLGEHDRMSNETGTIVRKVKTVRKHPGFKISHFNNDIAVLELESTVDIGGPHVRTACLPAEGGENYVGKSAIVAGWGRLDERKPVSRILQKVEVPIMSESDCKNAGYPESRITENMICAGYKEGKKDSCQGDSGGPMQINGTRAGSMEVIGIVSWGKGCARPNFPGVYTRVGNYLDWIQEQLGMDKYCCNLPVQPSVRAKDF